MILNEANMPEHGQITNNVLRAVHEVCDSITEEELHILCGNNIKFFAAMHELGVKWQEFKDYYNVD